MSIPIFWRLILGTMGILFLSVAVCLYTIIELGRLSHTARSALDRDHRMIGYQQALADSFLSEVRYGGKFIFTHADDRYEQMRQFQNDFTRYLGELKSLTESPDIAACLSKIDQFHRQYHELLGREVAYIRAKQTYAQSRYQQERDKVLESALAELERLKAMLQANLQAKLQGIDRAARTSRRVGILTTLAVVILGTWFSLKISKSIAAPLKQLELRHAANLDKPNESGWIAIESDKSSVTATRAAKEILARLTTRVEDLSAVRDRCLTLARKFTTGKASKP